MQMSSHFFVGTGLRKINTIPTIWYRGPEKRGTGPYAKRVYRSSPQPTSAHGTICINPMCLEPHATCHMAQVRSSYILEAESIPPFSSSRPLHAMSSAPPVSNPPTHLSSSSAKCPVTGLSHEFIAPTERDSRSVCPALNAMANHGYM
jgi:hypothetical protein